MNLSLMMTLMPMMPRSDDDLEDIDDDDDDNTDNSDQPNTQPKTSSPPPGNTQASNSDTLPNWCPDLTPVTIHPFTSPVGPKLDIPESPSDMLKQLFTPAFLDTIAQQSNLYTKEVMGEDKYKSWV